MSENEGSGRRGKWERREEPPPPDPMGRVPPHALEAEAAVLSALLLIPEAFVEVQDILRPEHCYAEANRRVLESVFDLQGTGKPVDLVTVQVWLRDRGLLERIGGSAYLVQLTEGTPAVANIGEHAKTIREKWRLRQLIHACQRFVAEGYADTSDVQGFIDRAEQSIFEIARTAQGSSVVPVSEAIRAAFTKISEAAKNGGTGVTGVSTGYTELDKLTAGLHDGDLYIVAGRPGMGKTSFVLNLAVNVARARFVASADTEPPVEQPGFGVAFFSLEMPKEQLAARLLSSEARVDVSSLRSGKLAPDDWNRLTDSASRLNRMPIWLDDTPAISMLDLRAKLRRIQAEISRGDVRSGKLGLVAIDYLQLMSGRKDAGSREQEISELSRGLKQLAKEMRVPVMALSQLNRSVETRSAKDKRPQLSDLRESGAIEQDADTILFVYRDDYYNKDSEKPGVAEIIIAKQRNGPTGTVDTRFTHAYTRFDNLAVDLGLDDQFDDFSGP